MAVVAGQCEPFVVVVQVRGEVAVRVPLTVVTEEMLETLSSTGCLWYRTCPCPIGLFIKSPSPCATAVSAVPRLPSVSSFRTADTAVAQDESSGRGWESVGPVGGG